jgi:cytochrome oxidase assembly protein ShyY1
MYRFLLRPKWLLGHVLFLAGVIAFVNFGFWQLRRLDERRDYNVVIAERAQGAAQDLASLRARYGDDPEDLEYWVAAAAGTYRSEEEVMLLARSFKGRSGKHVLTPLLLDDGTAVLVDRGWVDLDTSGPPTSGLVAAPAGPVTITGWLRRSEDPSTPGPRDAASGVLMEIGRVNLERLQQQMSWTLAPVYLELQSQVPGQVVPEVREPPEISDGPHLSYAVQWFVFAAIALIGYPILIRRQATRGGVATED